MKNTSIRQILFALIRLIIFSSIFIALFFILETNLHKNVFNHPTWTYATKPDSEPIDVLFVGNSHTYTSIDSEVLSLATDLNIRSLTCASINGTVVAADIEAFLNYSIPQVIVIEICPFSVNYMDNKETSKIGIVYEHFDAIPNIITRTKAISQVANFEEIPPGTFHLLRNTSMWTRWQEKSPNMQGYDLYGSNKKYSVFWNSYYDASQIKEQFLNYIPEKNIELITDEDCQALNKILDFSEEYDFEVWIYVAPLSTFDPAYANTLNYISSIQSDYPSIKYIDNSMLCLDEIGICRTDFYDDTHLNPNGMQKITLWMMDKIATRFNISADTSNIVRYYSTKVTLIDEDIFRYEVNTYGDAKYQFSYTDDSGNRITTDWSENNWLEETYIPTDKITVNVASLDIENTEVVTYSFLPYTLKGYTANINSDSTMEIINNSNFADNINFAWYITYEDNDSIIKYDYSERNNLILEFEKSGTYTISAFTKQTGNSSRISEDVITVFYDDIKKKLSIISQVDYITINYKTY